MTSKREKDEYLERLWQMKEEGKDSISELKIGLNGDFKDKIVEELHSDDMVELNNNGEKIKLTEVGKKSACRVIRAHRIAERLVHDVLGSEFEAGACEFEHIVSLELVDGICTLLGHPRECPHGMPIPEGECCACSAKTASSLVIPLTELKIGQSGRIAYVNCRDDNRLHRMDGLNIRPGMIVKLHQTYPTYVIECEGANIAIDEKIVKDICVWKENGSADDNAHRPPHGKGKRRRFFGRRRGDV